MDPYETVACAARLSEIEQDLSTGFHGVLQKLCVRKRAFDCP